MASSPSHSRRGRSPRWISRGMNRRGNPPKRFHPFRHCARRSAMRGHPPGCSLPGAFRRGGASCVTRLRTAIAAVAFPSHVPFLQRNRTGLSGSKKKKPYPYPNSPIQHIMPFSCFFLQKKRNFFFLRPPPHFGPFMLMAAKTVSSLWSEELLKEKKRAGLSFS